MVLRWRLPAAAVDAEGMVACAQYAPIGQTWRDPESLEDVPLVPGMTPMENQLRWGFVQKVCPRVLHQGDCVCSDAAKHV